MGTNELQTSNYAKSEGLSFQACIRKTKIRENQDHNRGEASP